MSNTFKYPYILERHNPDGKSIKTWGLKTMAHAIEDGKNHPDMPTVLLIWKDNDQRPALEAVYEKDKKGNWHHVELSENTLSAKRFVL